MSLSPDGILQTGMAFWASKTLLSAVELDVFTGLAKEPADLEALVRRQLMAAALHARVSQYERILGEAMSTLHEVVRVAEQAAAAAESVRESNEVFDNLFDA